MISIKEVKKHNFILQFFKVLSENNIRYAILRKYENIYLMDFNDIDFCLDKNRFEEAINILNVLCDKYGWRIYNTIYKDGLIAMHLYKTINGKLEIIHLDIFKTINWKGITVLDNEEVLQCITKYKEIFIVSKDCEAVICLLSRLLYHGYVKGEYRKLIQDRSFSVEVIKILEKIFNKDIAVQLCEDCRSSNWDKVEKSVSKLRKALILNRVRNVRNNFFIAKVKFFCNRINRFFNRKGICIVFLGTDGSGKSTIIDNVQEVLKQSYPREYVSYFHWRPKLILNRKRKQNGCTVTNPHEKKPYNKLISIIKFLTFNIDYILGYWLLVYPKLAKNSLVIFDRYYYDYFIDMYRYRIDLNINIIKFFNRLIPNPDITFLLTGDSKVIYERKKEISIEEIDNQISSIAINKKYFNNPKDIDVNKSIHDVIINVCEEILNFSKRRGKR